MTFTLRFVTTQDDINEICRQIRTDTWGADNEMTNYDPDSLRRFLTGPDNILLLAYDSKIIVGVALAYILRHPAGDDSLYVHELDTLPAYRRQGIAGSLMEALYDTARHRGIKELWVCTEDENIAAKKTYESLKPYEIEPAIIYSYKIR